MYFKENKKLQVTATCRFLFLFLKLFVLSFSYKEILNHYFINEISENASSRKLGNRNWFSQPLVHTVKGRTRALRALVLAHNCMNSWLGKPSSGFSTSGKRYISLQIQACLLNKKHRARVCLSWWSIPYPSPEN